MRLQYLLSFLLHLILTWTLSLFLNLVGFMLTALFLIIALVIYKANTGHNSFPDFVYVISMMVSVLTVIGINLGLFNMLKYLKEKFPRSSFLKFIVPVEKWIYTVIKITLVNIPLAETVIMAAIQTNDLLWFESKTFMPVCILLIIMITYQTVTLNRTPLHTKTHKSPVK